MIGITIATWLWRACALELAITPVATNVVVIGRDVVLAVFELPDTDDSEAVVPVPVVFPTPTEVKIAV